MLTSAGARRHGYPFPLEVSMRPVLLVSLLDEMSPTVQTLLRARKALGVKASTVIARVERG